MWAHCWHRSCAEFIIMHEGSKEIARKSVAVLLGTKHVSVSHIFIDILHTLKVYNIQCTISIQLSCKDESYTAFLLHGNFLGTCIYINMEEQAQNQVHMVIFVITSFGHRRKLTGSILFPCLQWHLTAAMHLWDRGDLKFHAFMHHISQGVLLKPWSQLLCYLGYITIWPIKRIPIFRQI